MWQFKQILFTFIHSHHAPTFFFLSSHAGRAWFAETPSPATLTKVWEAPVHICHFSKAATFGFS